jgi:hypothetical protein
MLIPTDQEQCLVLLNVVFSHYKTAGVGGDSQPIIQKRIRMTSPQIIKSRVFDRHSLPQSLGVFGEAAEALLLETVPCKALDMPDDVLVIVAQGAHAPAAVPPEDGI